MVDLRFGWRGSCGKPGKDQDSGVQPQPHAAAPENLDSTP